MSDRELLEQVQGIIPSIEQRAAATEEARSLPPETVADLLSTGALRAMQPRRFGGAEVDPRDFFEAVVDVGRVCGSTAWVLSVVGVHSWQLGLFHEKAQEDVWGGDAEVLVSSSYAPTGSVQRVEGGFVLSGRWSFSSGCDHAQWAFLGGVAPRVSETDRIPDMRTFLVPRGDYEIEDNWHVAGLSGSGSKDIVVVDAFVPEYRTHRFADTLAIDSPGNAVNTAPLFRMPFGGLFCNAIAAPALGVAYGVLASYRKRCRDRAAVNDKSKPETPTDQIRLAETAAALDGVHLQMLRNLGEMGELARAGTAPSLERRAWYRWCAARTTGIAAQVVDEVFTASGGHAIYRSNPLQRQFRDIHAMRAHANNDWQKTAQVYGRAAIGYPNREFLL